jgi:phage shock protein A
LLYNVTVPGRQVLPIIKQNPKIKKGELIKMTTEERNIVEQEIQDMEDELKELNEATEQQPSFNKIAMQHEKRRRTGQRKRNERVRRLYHDASQAAQAVGLKNGEVNNSEQELAKKRKFDTFLIKKF